MSSLPACAGWALRACEKRGAEAGNVKARERVLEHQRAQLAGRERELGDRLAEA